MPIVDKSNHTGHTGLLHVDYAEGRETKRSFRYRLWRRTFEVVAAIEQFAHDPVQDIIDLGTADGRMLSHIQEKYPHAQCVGVEYNQELVEFGKARFPELDIVQGDIESLNFLEETFDVAVATAVIEHVPSPEKALEEIRRVLRPEGIVVLTSPDPFWESLASRLGHLDEDQHHNVYNLKKLMALVSDKKFQVLKAEKFMLSPIGMPFEFSIEKIIRFLGLKILLANQLLVARKV
jgi:ubiquinone/menaquinone biosynthesis C-methylase UbiE